MGHGIGDISLALDAQQIWDGVVERRQRPRGVARRSWRLHARWCREHDAPDPQYSHGRAKAACRRRGPSDGQAGHGIGDCLGDRAGRQFHPPTGPTPAPRPTHRSRSAVAAAIRHLAEADQLCLLHHWTQPSRRSPNHRSVAARLQPGAAPQFSGLPHANGRIPPVHPVIHYNGFRWILIMRGPNTGTGHRKSPVRFCRRSRIMPRRPKPRCWWQTIRAV
jgi:hypothetical protein